MERLPKRLFRSCRWKVQISRCGIQLKSSGLFTSCAGLRNLWTWTETIRGFHVKITVIPSVFSVFALFIREFLNASYFAKKSRSLALTSCSFSRSWFLLIWECQTFILPILTIAAWSLGCSHKLSERAALSRSSQESHRVLILWYTENMLPILLHIYQE